MRGGWGDEHTHKHDYKKTKKKTREGRTDLERRGQCGDDRVNEGEDEVCCRELQHPRQLLPQRGLDHAVAQRHQLHDHSTRSPLAHAEHEAADGEGQGRSAELVPLQVVSEERRRLNHAHGDDGGDPHLQRQNLVLVHDAGAEPDEAHNNVQEAESAVKGQVAEQICRKVAVRVEALDRALDDHWGRVGLAHRHEEDVKARRENVVVGHCAVVVQLDLAVGRQIDGADKGSGHVGGQDKVVELLWRAGARVDHVLGAAKLAVGPVVHPVPLRRLLQHHHVERRVVARVGQLFGDGAAIGVRVGHAQRAHVEVG